MAGAGPSAARPGPLIPAGSTQVAARARLAFTLALGLPAGLASQTGPPRCGHPSSAPRLDHAVVVVPNLDSARARLAPLGFRFKAGRLHQDNLLNLHIKFRDGTEIELMSVAGPPGDANARDYAELLAAGAGGAYVALLAPDLDAVAAAATRAGLPYRRSAGRWQFLSFPSPSEARAVFFGSGWLPPNDADSVLDHPNGAEALDQAWVEGGVELDSLLSAVGAVPCDSLSLPDGRRGRAWNLARGSLVIVRPAAATALPRPVGVLLRARERTAMAPVLALPGFWLGLVPGELAGAN